MVCQLNLIIMLSALPIKGAYEYPGICSKLNKLNNMTWDMLSIYMFSVWWKWVGSTAYSEINRDFPGGPAVKNPLSMQGTRVRSLVWEDPTCCGTTKPVCHSSWACNYLKPKCSGACEPQSLKPLPAACAQQQEATTVNSCNSEDQHITKWNYNKGNTWNNI